MRRPEVSKRADVAVGQGFNPDKRVTLEGRGVRELKRADVAQLVEHSLGKGEVTSSILVISSRRQLFSY